MILQAWHIWIIVALICFIIEIFTSGFAVACFSIGALFSALGAGLGLNLVWQIIIFAVFSMLAFIFVRPLVLKAFFKKGEKKTNADALIGRRGRVSQSIDSQSGTGRVRLDGDDWKAVSSDGSFIPEGSIVTVISRDSIILTVQKD